MAVAMDPGRQLRGVEKQIEGLLIATLPETNIASENRSPKGLYIKSPNHPFSVAMSVSRRVYVFFKQRWTQASTCL